MCVCVCDQLAEEENDQRRRQEQMLLEKLEQEEQQEEETKVRLTSDLSQVAGFGFTVVSSNLTLRH